eukprot:scaffold163929_cov16-Tisochrysis_lutea.AAC.1
MQDTASRRLWHARAHRPVIFIHEKTIIHMRIEDEESKGLTENPAPMRGCAWPRFNSITLTSLTHMLHHPPKSVAPTTQVVQELTDLQRVGTACAPGSAQ